MGGTGLRNAIAGGFLFSAAWESSSAIIPRTWAARLDLTPALRYEWQASPGHAVGWSLLTSIGTRMVIASTVLRIDPESMSGRRTSAARHVPRVGQDATRMESCGMLITCSADMDQCPATTCGGTIDS